jgi:predicted N-acyltransferase
MQVTYTNELESISAATWNALLGSDNPFVRHEFLVALEQQQCLHPYGWQPFHLLVYNNHNMIGALPLYLKNHSHGEFVFDWAWASAYEQHFNQPYYPKLVCSIPYTPVTGPRLLIAPNVERTWVTTALINGAQQLAQRLRLSSFHCLFTDVRDTTELRQQPRMMARMGYQFHWHNRGYRDFADYLDHFTAKKRQQIRRERRDAQKTGVTIEILDGYQATEKHWALFHQFYRTTFLQKSNLPALSLNFFQAIASAMPAAIVLVMVHEQGNYIAGALNLRSHDTLYGRHWGCSQHFRHLHFEVCYYQTLEYCIQHGLQKFEAGAQGEHKMSRGFLPVATWSFHSFTEPRFAEMIERFLAQETLAVADYIVELKTHSPFNNN